MSLKEYMKKYKNIIILVLISIVLLFTNGLAVKQCNSYKDMNNNNIVALTDTIQYYKTKSNELYISKTLLLGDMKTLKLANDSLYNVIKEMKVKNASTVIHVDATIDNESKDTTWTIDKPKPEIVYPRLSRYFEFKDPYRELSGRVFLEDSLLGLNIAKDKVYLDYVIAVENNKVFIKSNNPYVQYNEIQGLTLPENVNKKRFATLVIGPSLGISYDFKEKQIAPTLGFSVTYGIDILNLFKK